jgi:hypothetical protein
MNDMTSGRNRRIKILPQKISPGTMEGRTLGIPAEREAQKKEQQFAKKKSQHYIQRLYPVVTPSQLMLITIKKKQTFIGPTLEHTQGPSLNTIQILKQFKRTAPKRTCFFYIFSF